MTKIEWTHRPGTIGCTWNPIRARNLETGGVGHYCVHASEGCRHCYAERLQPRFRNPIRYAAQDLEKVEVFLDEQALDAPWRWRKPRTVFACSMTDLFGEWVEDEWISRIIGRIAGAPEHTFIVLTKRAARMSEYMREREPKPLPNLWLGVSVEDQRTAEERIPHLLETPAAIRFISAEPLLGPVNIGLGSTIGPERRPDGSLWDWIHYAPLRGHYVEADDDCGADYYTDGPQIDWVIVGGESGPHARPMHPDWVRSIKDQCAAAGTPFFFKQWGEWAPNTRFEGQIGYSMPPDPLGGTKVAWPDGTIGHETRDEHGGSGTQMVRVGKSRAGRLLDGQEHTEWPG